MLRIVEGVSRDLADVARFLRRLEAAAEACDLFDAASDLFVGRAPGRLDVMGGIADYSGSLVLQLPIREATLAAVQRTPTRELHIVSPSGADDLRSPSCRIPLGDLEEDGRPVSYECARAYFSRDPRSHWAAYVAGVFVVLVREQGIDFAEGARIFIDSAVPEGKGVSSSAAIEVATMQAVAAAYDLELAPRETAILCQKVENLVVGAPCGVMDQMASACGEERRLLALLCQPAELQGMAEIPGEMAVWGVDSGIRHAVSGADYGSVRVGAFMGYRIIAELAGLEVAGSTGEALEITDPDWAGYLANVTPAVFEQRFAADLPVSIAGGDFLERYGGTTDQVTAVEPERDYAVRMPARHPVYEHHRVRAYAELLAGAPSERQLELLGELMYQSHASYSACGLGSEGTDRLVELARQAGPAAGIYGAKITGGGSGGTVAVLGRCDAATAVKHLAEQYANETGREPYLFSGSSPGAAAFGFLRLRQAAQ